MKRIYLIIGLVFVTTLALGQQVMAEDDQPMTDAHVEHVRAVCGNTQTSLRRIMENDAVVYANRYQTYYSIADKLMLRLNSRLVLNQLDGGGLLGVTADYSVARTQFQTSYRKYEEQMTRISKMDCRKEPVGFYDGVKQAQRLRSTVSDDVAALNSYIHAYGQAFGTLKSEFETKAKERAS